MTGSSGRIPIVDPGPLRDVLTVVAGVVTGVLSAAFGVGGAVVSTPAIRALGATAAIAVGTTLPSILPSAVSGTARYVRAGLIDWRVVRWTAPFGVVASVGGSVISRLVPGDGHWLMLLTAALLAFTAWRMAKPPAPSPAPLPSDPPALENGLSDADASSSDARPVVLVGIGAAAGLLSGLLGVGGGILMVPAFTELTGMSIKRAVATSLACVGVFAIPGTITHALLGGVDWRIAALLAIGVVPGARVGAAAAIASSDRRLRITVASFLGLISVVYAAGELIALAG